MAETHTDLEDLLHSMPTVGEFRPYCYKSEGADALTIKVRGDADYSKRLTDHVTIFRSIDTNEVTGCRIKGIKELLNVLPNFVHVKLEDAQVSILFLPFVGDADAETRNILNGLARAAGQLKLPCDAH